MANPETLRSGISDLVNDLVKIGNNSTDPVEQQALVEQINKLMDLWRRVILDQMDREAQDYKDALVTLGKAQDAASKAKDNLDKVADVIKKTAKAAAAIDKVLNFVLKALV